MYGFLKKCTDWFKKMYGLYGFKKKKLYGLFFENCTDFFWKCTDFCTDLFKKVLATLQFILRIHYRHIFTAVYRFHKINSSRHNNIMAFRLGITMLIHNIDGFEFVTEFPCQLGHPGGKRRNIRQFFPSNQLGLRKFHSEYST